MRSSWLLTADSLARLHSALVHRPYATCMTDLQRLEFEERDEQWYITEVYSDGRSQPGEPFMASGHERYSKLDQVMDRIKDKYPGYRPTRIPYDKVNAKRFLLEVVKHAE